MNNVVIIVGGPSGCGKTTTGQRIAAKLNCAFEEGDAYHSEANVEKMRRGDPLNDEDRWPWLHSLRTNVVEKYAHEARSVVLTCSALQRKYRDVLRGAALPAQRDVHLFFVMLTVPTDALVKRVEQRRGHYMPASLVHSQIALQEPLDAATEHGVQLDSAANTPDELADTAIGLLREKVRNE